MTIYINRFSSEIEQLKANIKNYEIVIYDILSIIKNMSFYWHDGYTDSFFQKIKNEIQDTNEFIDSLNTLYNFLSSTASQYMLLRNNYISRVGYTNIINQNNYIAHESDEEDISKLKIKIYNKISNIEDDAANNLSKVSVPTINKESFDNLTLNKEKSEFLGMKDNMTDEIKKVNLKKEEVRKKADLLKESINSIIQSYNSENSKRISKTYKDIADFLNTTNSNLTMSYNYIIQRKEKYTKTFKEMAESVKHIKVDS